MTEYMTFCERQNFGLAVSNVTLIDEAKRVAADLNIVGLKQAMDGLSGGSNALT